MDQKKPGGETKRPGGEMSPANPQESTKSQLLPLAANFGDIVKKPWFLPGVLVAIVSVVLFKFTASSSATYQVMYRGLLPVDVPVYSLIIGALIAGGTAYALYRMIGKPCPWWVMPAVAVFTGILVMSPIMSMIHAFYGSGGFGGQSNDSFPTTFVKMVFQAGLPEETLKAIPIAIGVWIALKVKDRASPAMHLRVAEPVDGILIGVASGLGFAFAETLFVYVPRIILGSDVALIYAKYLVLQKQIGTAHAMIEIQRFMPGHETSLRVLIPRLLGEISGHACYSGILGYYIGLAVMKPANRVQTILVGLAVAVSIHAGWNALSGNDFLQAVLAVVSFGLLGAAIVKARELSPNRDGLMASQLVDRFSRVHSRVHPIPVHATLPTPPEALREPPANVAPPAMSMTWDDASNLLVIEIGTARVPATPGAHLYARQAPGAEAASDDGVVAEVNANPNDVSVLGLKNLSKQTWEVTTDRGEKRELAPGRSVRLTRGTRILIGDLYADVK